MVLEHVLTHGIFFAIISTVLLLVIMVSFSPRIWAYSDYSDEIKKKAPPQTQKEKTLSIIVGLPWLIVLFGLPIFSTIMLENKLGGDISFWTAFINLFVLTTLVTLADVVILDWLIVSKITPKFVIIPGSEASDYKDFSYHYISHVKAFPVMVVFCLIAAALIWFF